MTAWRRPSAALCGGWAIALREHRESTLDADVLPNYLADTAHFTAASMGHLMLIITGATRPDKRADLPHCPCQSSTMVRSKVLILKFACIGA